MWRERTPSPPILALGLPPSSFSLLSSVSLGQVLFSSEIHSVYELRRTEPSGLLSRVPGTFRGCEAAPAGSVVPLGVLEGGAHGCRWGLGPGPGQQWGGAGGRHGDLQHLLALYQSQEGPQAVQG